MDGYQACWEMRAIEKAMPARGRSQIIAVTAMGGEVEKRRGLVEYASSLSHESSADPAEVWHGPVVIEAVRKGDDPEGRGRSKGDTVRGEGGCRHGLGASPSGSRDGDCGWASFWAFEGGG